MKWEKLYKYYSEKDREKYIKLQSCNDPIAYCALDSYYIEYNLAPRFRKFAKNWKVVDQHIISTNFFTQYGIDGDVGDALSFISKFLGGTGRKHGTMIKIV